MRNMWRKVFGTAALAFMLCLTGLIISGTAFADRCVDNGDGTVTDNSAGLMWQKATAGQIDWNYAMSYASSLSLGGHSDWRLPNKDELYGLYNSPCKNIMDVIQDWYWSSTPCADGSDCAWGVGFYNGSVDYCGMYNLYRVRAVRAGQ